MNAVLDAMGGLLKSENEVEASQQEKKAEQGDALYRVTAMFSATMPTEIERLARKYLRCPAIVQIGDEDSGKNKRIEQRVMFTTEAQKQKLLFELCAGCSEEDKFIIFVNAKKSADGLARALDRKGFHAGSLHGGRTQDQREQNLESFREGYYRFLVATDVASRGLDVPDITHVVNFDMPSKIEPYCHRIGRTGRAGREGTAISFVTDGDDEIMYDLKQYLISTESDVPPQLAHHPSAQAPAGSRNDDGKLVSQRRRDTVIFAK